MIHYRTPSFCEILSHACVEGCKAIVAVLNFCPRCVLAAKVADDDGTVAFVVTLKMKTRPHLMRNLIVIALLYNSRAPEVRELPEFSR